MSRHSPTMILVHVVWATKRRRPLLRASFDDVLAAIISKKARDCGCVLLASGCGPDHVHSLLRVSPLARLAELVQRIKGGSAYDANHYARVPVPIHWQARYWAESFGPRDFDRLAAYLRSQRRRHDRSQAAERWQFDNQRKPPTWARFDSPPSERTNKSPPTRGAP